MPTDPRPAVVLLSGGLDSATVLAIARADGFMPTAISFDYGQRHAAELDCAKRLAQAADVPQVVVKLDGISGSALTGDSDVPMHDTADDIDPSQIPATYVPARNTVFLSHALSLAEQIEATHIWLGVNALDYSGYPDCRPEYIEAFEEMANLATKRGVEGHLLLIHTPLIDRTKAEIVRWGLELGVDYANTHSCYAPVTVSLRPAQVAGDPWPRPLACGRCDSCLLRLRAFEEVGVPDPVEYAAQPV